MIYKVECENSYLEEDEIETTAKELAIGLAVKALMDLLACGNALPLRAVWITSKEFCKGIVFKGMIQNEDKYKALV